MTLTVQTARAGARGIDCDTRLDDASCHRLKAAGIDFVVRYVRDVTRSEFASIMGAGLACMGVSHVRYAGWRPTAGMGAMDGKNIADAAQRCGFLPSTTIWCDVEGVAPDCSSTDVIVYANAWYDAVSATGLEPGIYVGAGSILTASQLFHALKFQRYWKSGSSVPEPDVRGFCLIQQSPLDVMFEGIQVDHDVVQADKLGDLPSWTVDILDEDVV